MDTDSENTCIECGCTRPRYAGHLRCVRHLYGLKQRAAFRLKFEALSGLLALLPARSELREPPAPVVQEPPEEEEERPYRYRPYRCNARGCEERRAEDSEFCAAHTEAFARRCAGENWRGGRAEYVG